MANIFFVRHERKKLSAARCILLSDITPLTALIRETEIQSELLKNLNEQTRGQNDKLQESIRLDEEASALRIRSLLLRNIHDTLGHNLVVANALYKLAEQSLPDGQSTREKLAEAQQLIGISLAQMESAGDYTCGSFTAFLKNFSVSMERAGLTIAIDISGIELPEHSYMYANLVSICQEAATNAIKHGCADRLEITYRISRDDISLFIKDNGKSSKPLKKGIGIMSMDDRVNDLFGDFSYGFCDDGGFFVSVDAPVIRNDEQTAINPDLF